MSAVIPCPCPGTPHPDGDTITFRERLDFERAMIIRNEVVRLVRERPGQAAALAVLTRAYALVGIESWTLVDAKRKPVPVTPLSIAVVLEGLADDPVAASNFADVADDLYAERYVLPLVREAPTSSPDTPTDESTSATNHSEPTPENGTPSSPSSTSTSPTDDTAMTFLSLAGVSS